MHECFSDRGGIAVRIPDSNAVVRVRIQVGVGHGSTHPSGVEKLVPSWLG